ncbi:MAG: precorrin-3B synthase, partial [Acidisphaera sp.]|nr:precorrin-3B synthase [Acidisphaera sp.]
QFGDGTLRLTPWRALVLPGIAAIDLRPLSEAVDRLGLITKPDDPRRMIIGCSGLPRCAAASVNVRSDALLLLGLPLSAPVHISGCAKGCAHPGTAPVTLVGAGGRYDLIRNGRASDPAPLRGLTMHQAVELLRRGT